MASETHEQLGAFLQEAIDRILRAEDPQPVMDWAVNTAPGRHGALLDSWKLPEHARSVACLWLVREIWARTPLPGNDFRRRPLPAPARNDPCPCGSGRKFKRCCRELSDSFEALDEEIIWPFYAQALSAAQRRKVVESAPPQVRLVVAEAELDQGHPGRARDLLTPLFDGDDLRDSAAMMEALELLTEIYEELGQDRPRLQLLERVVRHGRGELAGQALTVLAAEDIAAGQAEQALLRLQQAERRFRHPHPGIGLLRCNALAGAGRLDEVVSTAREWRRRLEEEGVEDEDLWARFAVFEADPEAATLARIAAVPDELAELEDWVAQQPEMKGYTLEDAGEMDEPGGAPRAHAYVAVLSAELDAAEAAWYDDALDVRGDGVPQALAQDLLNLREYPQALGSVDVLNRLIDLLHAVGAEGPVSVLEARRGRLLEQLLAQLPAGGLLPWGFLENRPILTALYEAAEQAADADPTQAIGAYEQLLRLNPMDNVGARMELMNLLLRQGRDEQALALAQRYPDDFAPALRYGRVLALYRLGRREEAAEALAEAAESIPKVLDYLIAACKPKPEVTPGMVRLGGDDEAWLYRDAMRDVFARTEGMLDWLKRHGGAGG